MSNKQIAINAYDISKIYQLEMLYHKYWFYLDSDINNILGETSENLRAEFLSELHEWHLGQPEGIKELTKNTKYYDDIWMHSDLNEPDQCTLEGPYRKILVNTNAYHKLYPQGVDQYKLLMTTYGAKETPKPQHPKLTAMLKGLKRT